LQSEVPNAGMACAPEWIDRSVMVSNVEPTTWSPRPARGYRWKTYEPTHGAWSPATYEPRAFEIADALLSYADEPGSPISYLSDPSYRPAVDAWARIESRCSLLADWLSTRGLLDEKGKPRPATDLLDRLEKRGETLRGVLGLTPLSRSRLGRNIAAARVDLAQLLSDPDEDGHDGES
jgi:hypothetical protein